MLRRRVAAPFVLVLAFGLAGPAIAIQTCELDGQPVNPANGATTAGKTGLMRCKDADTGMVVREQELRDGRFMGVVRYFKDGQVEREFSVDERGNRSGRSREWSVAPGGARVLVREETDRDSHAVGLVRAWTPAGQRRRLAFHDDDGRELASVEFDADGRLTDLRCAARPVFGADFDDRTACGHAGGASAVTLYGRGGQPSARVAYERGERRKLETLGDGGAVRELRETTAEGSLERSFAADGTPLRETRWQALPGEGGSRGGRVKVLEREFHPTGRLVHETRWAPTARGGAVLVAESRWYLNGQPRERIEVVDADGRRIRRETRFFDDGKTAFEGSWAIAAGDARSGRDERPVGTHKRFDEQGRLRGESLYDAGGRLARERELDAAGTVVRDDEVFEDGSRKSVGR